MGVLVKYTGAAKDIQKVKAHVKYVGFRSKEIEGVQLGFFSKDSENTDYKEFIKRIETNKALKHPSAVKAHKLVFSLKDKDYEAYKSTGKDYKDLIRATLKEYEDRNNVKLDWIASIHEKDGKGNTNHPHVHVIIKAVSDRKDTEGKYKRIFFKKEDYQQMRSDFDKEFERYAQYSTFERLDKNELDKTTEDIAKGFEAVLKGIENDIKKEEYEQNIKKM